MLDALVELHVREDYQSTWHICLGNITLDRCVQDLRKGLVQVSVHCPVSCDHLVDLLIDVALQLHQLRRAAECQHTILEGATSLVSKVQPQRNCYFQTSCRTSCACLAGHRTRYVNQRQHRCVTDVVRQSRPLCFDHIQLLLGHRHAVSTDTTLQDIVREDCRSIDLHIRITLDQLGDVFSVCRTMTTKRLLVTRVSHRRNMTVVDGVPRTTAHCCFDNVGHTHKSLAVLLRSHAEKLANFSSHFALTRSPLSSQTVTSAERITQQSVCLVLHRLGLEDQQVIETTQFRNLSQQLCSRVRVCRFQVRQNLTEYFAFTCATTGVTHPCCDTQSEVIVLHESRSELRDDVLTTGSTDGEE